LFPGSPRPFGNDPFDNGGDPSLKNFGTYPYKVICFSPDGEGEEIALPYEDNEIFSYLDNQEIPPVLLEVLEKTQHCHMYSGCVVCEVRDYRSPSQTGGSNYNRHLLLLRPTAEVGVGVLRSVEAHEI